MDKELEVNKTKHRKKSLIDRLQKLSGDDEPVITKGKLRKIKEKLNEPKIIVNERFDGWGDDLEVCINEKEKRGRK